MLFNMSAAVVTLLSNHRHSQNANWPATLSKTKLTNLLRKNASPNNDVSLLNEEISRSLEHLEAEGEIFQGARNHYCIASPTLLSDTSDYVTWLIFKGDRAYLSLAHDQLKTEQDPSEIKLALKGKKFDSIQAKLAPIGINLLTHENLAEHLHVPQEPPTYALRCSTELPHFDEGQLSQYLPKPHIPQADRWQIINSESTRVDRRIIKLSQQHRKWSDQYFWWNGSELYELEKEAAILAMFQQDLENSAPLRVIWDTSKGKLDLSDIYLPPSYQKCLWQLSQETETYRVRSVPVGFRPLVDSALRKLGCQLL
jgi:hypothetical protein